MATHDYVIANGTGSAVRSDINNVLAAIVSTNSASSEPSTKYAYQFWADTNTGYLKIRNAANNAWIQLFKLDGTLSDIPVEGTVVKSTGESGGTKYLREDGDGTCSWQSVATGAALTGSTNNTLVSVTGANAIAGEANLTFDGSQLGIGSSANYGTIGTAAAFQVQGTNTGSNTSMNIVNAATSNASSTCDVNAWQDYRLSTRIISGRENANNWTSGASGAASFLAFYTNNAGTVAEKVRIPSTGGITFNGDTAAANALNDYEIGDYTPTDTSGASLSFTTNNTGKYTKIGRLVTCHFDITYPTTTDGSVTKVSLPFTATTLFGGGVANFNSLGFPSFVHVSGTIAYLMDNSSSLGHASAHLLNSECSGKRFACNFWYYA